MKDAMKLSLRKMFGVCDITSNGGIDFLAENVSETKQQFGNRRKGDKVCRTTYNSPPEKGTRSSSKPKFEHHLPIVKQQKYQQSMDQEHSEQKKKKYLKKLRAVSMQHL